MSNQLPERPNLDHLREQAKDLLSSYRAGNPAATARVESNLPGFQNLEGELRLHDAQSVVAREYGFVSWTKLVEHVEQRLANLNLLQDAATTLTKAAFTDKVGLFVDAVNSQPGLARLDLATALAWGELETVKRLMTQEKLEEKFGPAEQLPLEYVAYSRVHQADPPRYEGLLECARFLLDLGADPNARHDYEGAPIPVLYGASSESGHAGIVRLLLERGANPNDGESVFHAVQYNRRDVLDVLVEFGADISGADAKWHNTPLGFNLSHRPSDSGHARAMKGIEYLLELGADPNVPTGSTQEPLLHLACMTGQPGWVFEMLLRHGADPTVRFMGGHSAYEAAIALGNDEAADVIARYGGAADVGAKARMLAEIARGGIPENVGNLQLNPIEKEVLHKWAESGNVEGVRAGLDSGFEIDFRAHGCGETALHQAAYCGRYDVVRLLLDRGADYTIQDSMYNATPFGWAIHATMFNRNPAGNYLQIVKDLVLAGSTPELAREIANGTEAPEDVQSAILEVLP